MYRSKNRKLLNEILKSFNKFKKHFAITTEYSLFFLDMNLKDNSVPVYTENFPDINEEQFDRPGSGMQYSKLFTFLFHVQSAKGKKKEYANVFQYKIITEK